MSSSDQYKREIMKDLAAGNKEILEPNGNDALGEKYNSFDDFADRSSRDERHGFLKRSFNPERVPATQMDPGLRQAIEKIKPNQRDDVAREIFKHLKVNNLGNRIQAANTTYIGSEMIHLQWHHGHLFTI